MLRFALEKDLFTMVQVLPGLSSPKLQETGVSDRVEVSFVGVVFLLIFLFFFLFFLFVVVVVVVLAVDGHNIFIFMWC